MTERLEDLTRRRFVRNVGASLVSITVADLLFGKSCLASACGEGASDSTCGGSSHNLDENCGLSGDSDNNCGNSYNYYNLSCYSSGDANCGRSTTSGTTAGPGGMDVDEACTPSVSDSDRNCGISYNPAPAVDVDNACNVSGGDKDESCGDCNDNHQTDEHCGKSTGSETDADELCGHQHTVSGTTDRVCSVTESDVGCGTHSNDYARWNWTDRDEHCEGENADRNCGNLTSDATCNGSHSPSSTSPDENCGAADTDDACSLYDRDESCGNGNKDEACGITTVAGWRDTTDKDENCGRYLDPDSSTTHPCPLGSG